MAEVIVKSIRSTKQPKQTEVTLADIPTQSKSEREPKEDVIDKRKYPRPRAGNMQMAPNPYGKPRIIEKGKKIK